MRAKLFAILGLVLLLLCGCASSQMPEHKNLQQAGYIVENKLLIEHEYCDVYIRNITETVQGIAVNFIAENKTDKIHLWLSGYDTSVNGYMIDAPWGLYIDVGETGEVQMLFPAEKLAEHDIETAGEISFSISGFNDDELVEEYLFFLDFSIFPTGNEDFKPAERIAAEGEKLLLDNDAILLIAEDFQQKANGDCLLTLYAENRTDKNLYLGLQDIYVNEQNINAKSRGYVSANKRLKMQLLLEAEQLAAKGLENIDQLQGAFKAWYYDNEMHKDIFVVNELWEIELDDRF